MPNERATCSLCGELMAPGETMFKYHGSLGPCPKPPLPRPPTEREQIDQLTRECAAYREALGDILIIEAERPMFNIRSVIHEVLAKYPAPSEGE